MDKKMGNNLVFWGFLTPVLIAFFLVVVIPFFIGIYFSFTSWHAIPGKPILWVGAANYIEMVGERLFQQSFIVTIVYTFYSVLLINVIGFALALLVTQELKSANLLRTTFFMPNLIGGIILGYIWKFVFLKISPALYEQIQLAFLNWNWLGDANTAIFATAVVSTWQMAGYIMVIYVAAIQGIPDDLLESASIDGAQFIHRVRHIIFPMVAPAFTASLFLTLSYSLKQFDVNFSLTGGAPAGKTELLTLNIWTTAIPNQNFGGGQAKAVVFFVVVTVITLTQVYFSKKREVEL
jgi:raffinose/stachyose/melibiose transport system permease protein